MRSFSLLRYFVVVGLATHALLIALGVAGLGALARQEAARVTVSTALSLAEHQHTMLFPGSPPAPGLPAADEAEFEERVRHALAGTSVVRLNVWDARGGLIYSTDDHAQADHGTDSRGLRLALAGQPYSEVTTAEEERLDQEQTGELVEVYVPLRAESGAVVGALEIYLPLDQEAYQTVLSVGRRMIPAALALLALQLAVFLSIAYQGDRALRQQEELVHRVQRLATIGQFSAAIAHELRNPVGIVSNALVGLRSGLGDHPDERVARQLELMDRELQRSRRIMDDLSDLARLKPPARQRVELAELVRASLGRLEVPPTVEVRLELEEATVIRADPGQLQQAVLNLAKNGLEAMGEAGELTVRVERAEGGARISVRDTGPGVSPQVADRLFEPLVTDKVGGTGLGLAIVKTVVDAHGGEVRVESEPGQGTSFTLLLPAG